MDGRFHLFVVLMVTDNRAHNVPICNTIDLRISFYIGKKVVLQMVFVLYVAMEWGRKVPVMRIGESIGCVVDKFS